ncbi:IQ and ubiquitin-like domain-containing protein [Saccostrea echinata]|uniref:IQ and ubiquitin-like domain-containing protein n=1 Tax=Saccostrea echinata TaxID=191078 RepID=UPI002A807781|nr:IQ and ubiquitin-like domain-containing protein [Saccostrea echinata]
MADQEQKTETAEEKTEEQTPAPVAETTEETNQGAPENAPPQVTEPPPAAEPAAPETVEPVVETTQETIAAPPAEEAKEETTEKKAEEEEAKEEPKEEEKEVKEEAKEEVKEEAKEEKEEAKEEAKEEPKEEVTQESTEASKDAAPEGEKKSEEKPSEESTGAEKSEEPPREDTIQQAPAPTPQPTQTTGMGTMETGEGHETDPHATTPRTTANLEATATVKIVLMPSGQVVTLACTLGQTLHQLKDHFSQELKMPVQLILLMFDGKAVEDTTTLADLGVGPNGTVQLEMQSADPVNTPIKTYRPRQEYHMPDVITVRVQTDENAYKDVVVEIERATRKKPYLGGYRHKKTGVLYHHATAQTIKKQPPPSQVPRNCRDTQTVQQRHHVQQTTNDTSTQMTGIGVYVSNMEDKLMVPGKYTTADEHHSMIFKKVIIIQKYHRRWLAKRYVEKLKQDKIQRLEWERLEELKKKKEKEERIKKEFERRMNPKTKEDFDLLYHALEKWRQEELERINGTSEGAERKAALCMLLDQETQLISAIGRHKLEADSENKEKRIQAFLSKAAAPKKWKGHDGKTTEMDTPYTIRAKELRDIYNSINMKYLTQDERLDVLLTLKHTVKEHDCKLTQEIIELIDREADLLMRGVREGNLEGLRKRISTLFLQYIKTPTFNPEAAKLLKVPQDPSVLRKNIYFCPSCNQYLPSTEFALASNSRTVGKCQRCTKIDNDARTRQDYSTYTYMLKMLRRAEERYSDGSRIAFLLQEQDLRYLVEKIWSCQSILSAWDDIFDLVLSRWDKHQEWSPWNCILLTKDEAAAHERLHDLEEGYGLVFIQKVQQKHVLARNYFSRLPGMAEHLRAKANDRLTQPNGPAISGQQVPVQSRA